MWAAFIVGRKVVFVSATYFGVKARREALQLGESLAYQMDREDKSCGTNRPLVVLKLSLPRWPHGEPSDWTEPEFVDIPRYVSYLTSVWNTVRGNRGLERGSGGNRSFCGDSM